MATGQCGNSISLGGVSHSRLLSVTRDLLLIYLGPGVLGSRLPHKPGAWLVTGCMARFDWVMWSGSAGFPELAHIIAAGVMSFEACKASKSQEANPVALCEPKKVAQPARKTCRDGFHFQWRGTADWCHKACQLGKEEIMISSYILVWEIESRPLIC